jgi:hypothetical protein
MRITRWQQANRRSRPSCRRLVSGSPSRAFARNGGRQHRNNHRPPPTRAPTERLLIAFHVSRFTHHASRIMNTNLNTPIPAARGITGEGWAAIAGAIGSAFLLAKKLLSPKCGKSEHIWRSRRGASVN